jgi:hypothetical protein
MAWVELCPEEAPITNLAKADYPATSVVVCASIDRASLPAVMPATRVFILTAARWSADWIDEVRAEPSRSPWTERSVPLRLNSPPLVCRHTSTRNRSAIEGWCRTARLSLPRGDASFQDTQARGLWRALGQGALPQTPPSSGAHRRRRHAACVREPIEADGVPLAADFFSGAGGLSLGLEQAGFKVILSADNEPFAIRTHAHHFGGMSVDWDLSDPKVVAKIAELVSAAGIDLVAGGPPCQPFSKAGRSMLRYRVQAGLRDPHDERRDLWRSFLEIIERSRPKAVLMENVPDMALDREMFILRSMVEELEQIGYSVEQRVVDTWRYGVPQFRQRLTLVAQCRRTRSPRTQADSPVEHLLGVRQQLRPIGHDPSFARSPTASRVDFTASR